MHAHLSPIVWCLYLDLRHDLGTSRREDWSVVLPIPIVWRHCSVLAMSGRPRQEVRGQWRVRMNRSKSLLRFLSSAVLERERQRRTVHTRTALSKDFILNLGFLLKPKYLSSSLNPVVLV